MLLLIFLSHYVHRVSKKQYTRLLIITSANVDWVAKFFRCQILGEILYTRHRSGWLTCNMGCCWQSLMKLAPMNGLNVCEVVFVPEMDISITCFNFRTIYPGRFTELGKTLLSLADSGEVVCCINFTEFVVKSVLWFYEARLLTSYWSVSKTAETDLWRPTPQVPRPRPQNSGLKTKTVVLRTVCLDSCGCVGDMRLPSRVQEAMQMQVEAERKKRAAILESEGSES